MNPTTQKGYFILADITGFTPFVATTELEHSQEILENMLKGILSFLTPPFKLAEVEGDAVFVYSTKDKFPRGEMILDVIEAAYFAFRDRKSSFHRIRTCECKACQMASSLDLKFIIHYGDFIMNNVGGKNKPLGPSINVAHRLLKNRVTETTGWKAYALFTKDCADVIGINSPDLHPQRETYEHIGDVETLSIDLDNEYKNHINERRVCLSPEEANFVVQKDFNVSPGLLWPWFNTPKKKNSWSIESDWHVGLRPSGRMGKGATNHCANSKFMEKILDYRPFEYYTSTMGRGPLNITLTSKFEPIPTGTRLTWYVKMHGILPTVIKKFICRMMLENGIKIHQGFEKLFTLVEAEKEESGVASDQ